MAGGAGGGVSRLSTGIAELDHILSGGLFPGRTYLVVGPSGTGKTTMALSFLREGIRRGETVLFVTLEEPPNEVRANHQGMRPELDRVHVFDAIPDVMRYERTPFKDIAAVRSSVPFDEVAASIRKTPELSSVEVTFTALEQTLKMEMARRNYSRLVIDSLTALQYFCMKGFDESIGAQTFLRFLSDLRVTTLLTVEAPLEDAESPERLLARGEVRLFRWEHEGRTIRAIGVEKFRGSPHDIRLHPYRIGPRGIDINLDVTISRDTHLEISRPEGIDAVAIAGPAVEPAVADLTGPGLAADLRDLAALGYDLSGIRSLLEEARRSLAAHRAEEVRELLSRVSSRIREAVVAVAEGPPPPPDLPLGEVWHRLLSRAEASRTGIPPIPPDLDRLRTLYGALWDAAGTPAAVGPAPPAPMAAAPAPTLTIAPQRSPSAQPPAKGFRNDEAPAPPAPPPELQGPPPLPNPVGELPSIMPVPAAAGPRPEPAAAPTAGRAATDRGRPVLPDLGPAGPAGSTEPSPGPKRRRKPALTRRKPPAPAGSPAAAPGADAVPPSALPTDSAPPVGAVPPGVPGAGGAEGSVVPPKPKRRAPRKRKAPPVTAAEPGPPPPPAEPSAAPPAAPPPPPVPPPSGG